LPLAQGGQIPLHLFRLVGGLALLAASTVLQGCDRSGRRAEETSQAAPPGDSAGVPAASLPQQIAVVVVKLNGGVHTGFRFMHAKGIVVSGTFTPSKEAKSVSRAAHFSAPSVPVTVRFSNAPGIPTNADNSPGSGPRGMAIRFTLPGGAFTDIVSISHNGFVVGTGDQRDRALRRPPGTAPLGGVRAVGGTPALRMKRLRHARRGARRPHHSADTIV
jgi:Catalase